MLTFLVFFPVLGAIVIATLPRDQERNAKWMALAVTGAIAATPCGLGTFQSLSGQTACLQADPGSFVNATGATFAALCDPGTFQDLAGQTGCNDAPAGSFVNTTGAASAVAARYMAREDASVVGVIGSGFQAVSQLEAICKVRPISSARVYSPNAEHRNAYAKDMSERLGIEVTPVQSARLAVEGVDILVTITASPTPVFDGDWLQPGTHVTAVGGANAYVTELDDITIQRSDVLVVDDVAQARIECGELIMPASRGIILWEQLRELWQVVGGVAPGRNSPQDITLFKSLGMALWDIAVAKAVYDKAVVQGVGTAI